MLYLVNGKVYIKVSGYFKEVEVSKNKNNDGYDVKLAPKANENKIEISRVKDYTGISVENAYKRKSKSPMSSNKDI